MTIWVTADRRIPEDRIVKTVIEGNFNSLYFYKFAAVAAAYPTEKVWRIEIEAKQEGK